MGVKKSTVCTRARLSLIRKTPASSLVSNPTSTFGFVCRGSFLRTASRVAGFNFAAHPAAFAIDVSFRAEATFATSFCYENLNRHYRDTADLVSKDYRVLLSRRE